MKTFEEYLKDIHAESYKGLDDEMSDNFNSWTGELDVNELIEYAELYGEICYKQGEIDTLKDIIKVEFKKHETQTQN